MAPDQVQRLQRAFILLVALSDDPVAIFWRHLSSRSPEMKALFGDAVRRRSSRLSPLFLATINELDQLTVLRAKVANRALMFKQMGLRSEHLPVVKQAFFEALAEVFGERFDPSIEDDWKAFYDWMYGPFNKALLSK